TPTRPHLALVIRHWSSAICHLPFAICHPPSAICHLPFTIRRLPSAICHLPFLLPHSQRACKHPPCGCCSGRSPRKLPKPSQVGAPRSSKSKEWKSCRAQHEASEGRQERDSHEHAWGLVGWCLGHCGCIARASLDGGSAGAGVHR